MSLLVLTLWFCLLAWISGNIVNLVLVFNFEDDYLKFTLGSDLQSYLNCISPLFKTIFMNSDIHSQIFFFYGFILIHLIIPLVMDTEVLCSLQFKPLELREQVHFYEPTSSGNIASLHFLYDKLISSLPSHLARWERSASLSLDLFSADFSYSL